MADDSNKLEVQIVLDDGSVQRGFIKIQKQADDAAKKTEKSFSEAMTETALQVAAVGGSFYLLKKAAEAAINGIKLGEKIQGIERQFQLLAAQAGVAGDVIREKLIGSADGLVDDNGLLQAANRAFIELGSNARQLPEIFEIAKRAAVFTGRDAAEVFETINTAIANQQTKQLKGLGIIIDARKAMENYAISLGVTADALSQSGRQQAILNAFLEQGNAKFKNIDPNQSQLTNNVTRLKVAVDQLGDAFAVVAAKSDFTKGLSDRIGELARVTREFADPITKGSAASEENIKRLNKEIAQTEFQLSKVYEVGTLLRGAIVGDIQPAAREAALNEQLIKQRDILASLTLEQKRRKDAEGFTIDGKKKAPAGEDSKTEVDRVTELELRKQSAIAGVQSQAQSAFFIGEEARIQNIEDINQRELESKQLFDQRLLALGQDREQKLLDIKKTFSAQAGYDDAEREQVRLAILAESEAKISALRNNTIRKEKQDQISRLQTYSSIAGQIATLQQDNSNTLAGIGKAAAITQATIDGYLAVQNALAHVPYPFNFAAAALVGAAAASNIARIAATGPGGGSGSFSGGGIGGGELTTPATKIGQFEPAAEQKPQTKIELVVQGSIFDSDSTGTRIVDLLNQAFDQNGVVVTGRNV